MHPDGNLDLSFHRVFGSIEKCFDTQTLLGDVYQYLCGVGIDLPISIFVCPDRGVAEDFSTDAAVASSCYGDGAITSKFRCPEEFVDMLSEPKRRKGIKLIEVCSHNPLILLALLQYFGALTAQ